MSQSEAPAWWAEVQHVREAIERRRADADSPDGAADLQRGGRFARSTDNREADELAGQLSGRRFDRSGHANHVPVDPDRARARGRRSEVREHWTGVERRDPSRADRRASGRAGHHDPTGVDRRDPGRDDRRARGAAGHHASARSEHRDSARSEHRDLVRGERRDSARAERREVIRPDRRDAGLSAPRARRTVQITGRPVAAPRLVEVERRRPVRRPVERIGGRPDRIALWAVLFCFFLILVALSS
jgi:hypothetical protein